MKRLLVSITATSLLLVAALLVSVFLGAQAADPGTAGPHKEIIVSIEETINGEITAGNVRLLFADAPELPNKAPSAFGVFLRQTGNKITLGSGSIEVEVRQEVINDQEMTPEVSINHTGPEVSLLLNADTKYLQDTTRIPEISRKEIEAGQVIVPGKVTNSSREELINLFTSGEPLILRVWGAQKDGELIAELLVFEIIE